MEVTFYKAECGDAARIRFLGNDNKFHNIFIDSGYDRTFRFVLIEEIKDIAKRGEMIDLWLLSHIHDDHIGGISKYLDLINSGELNDIVSKWFYNVPRSYSFKPRNLKNASQASSIKQGDKIFEYLKNNNKLLSNDITNELESINLYGLNMTILSPTKNKLSKLRNKYPLDIQNELERFEQTSVSDAKAMKQNDYSIKIHDFDLVNFTEDKSIENGTSISVITEYNNQKILWLADSHPSDICESLKKLGYSEQKKIECDWVKVSHHGSSGNNSSELYNLITCSNYLFSVNGENKHNLPEKRCLSQILRSKNRNKDSYYNFSFTYDNDLLRNIFKVDGTEVYNELNFNVNFLGEDKYLKIKL